MSGAVPMSRLLRLAGSTRPVFATSDFASRGRASMQSNISTTGFGLAAVCAVVLVLGGCAQIQDMAGVPRSGYQKDGTYVVSPDEEKLACRQLRDRLEILSRELSALPERAAYEQKSGPTTVTGMLGRMFGGPGDGLSATTDYQRASAESEAIGALIVRKKCDQGGL